MVTQRKSPHGRRHGPIYESPPVLARGMLVLIFILSMLSYSSAQNLINGGTINNSGTIRVKNQATGLPSTMGGTFELFGGSQTVPSINYGTLLLSGSGTKTTAAGDFQVAGDLTIGSAVTMQIESNSTVALGGTLYESGKLNGKISRSVVLSGSSGSSNFGGIGATISWNGTAPGSTSITRSSGSSYLGGGNQSVKRSYNIVPATNSGLNASLVFWYSDDELDGHDPRTLQLWKSTNGGASWTLEGGTVDTSARTITKTGITSFSLWTAADSSNPLSGPGVVVNTKILMEGPFSGGSMSTSLRSLGYVPLNQPYSTAPWNYGGTENVASIPGGAVDWILVELRSVATGPAISTRAAFVKSDGTIVDTDGNSTVSFTDISDGNYYIVVRHRNHLAVMSADAVALSGSSNLYDFTTGQAQAYGTDPLIDLGSGVYGMWAGDVNGSGVLNATDRGIAWNERGLEGYYASDINLSGVCNATDRGVVWNNRGKETQVP